MGKAIKHQLSIAGFSRVQLAKNGRVMGDSGWEGPNQITQSGFELYLCKLLASTTGSLQVNSVALGTGGAPASDAVTLPGEISGSTMRTSCANTYLSSGSTHTIRFYGTFGSTVSFLAGSSNISNIGLYYNSATNDTGASLFAGNTYASSQCSTNQDVYFSYEIRFSTA